MMIVHLQLLRIELNDFFKQSLLIVRTDTRTRVRDGDDKTTLTTSDRHHRFTIIAPPFFHMRLGTTTTTTRTSTRTRHPHEASFLHVVQGACHENPQTTVKRATTITITITTTATTTNNNVTLLCFAACDMHPTPSPTTTTITSTTITPSTTTTPRSISRNRVRAGVVGDIRFVVAAIVVVAVVVVVAR